MQTKEQIIEDLKNIPYEVSFSRESVIEIIESVESRQSHNKLDFDKIQEEITELVIDALENMFDCDLVENPTFRLSGNEIEVDTFDINQSAVKIAVKTVLIGYFEQFEEETND